MKLFNIFKKNNLKKENVSLIQKKEEIKKEKDMTQYQEIKFRVDGTTHYIENIESLGYENTNYTLTKKEIIDEFLYNEYIYEYCFGIYTVTLVDEPENKFNSKAIKVLFDNVHVGYIKDGFISRIKNLLKKDVFSIEGEITGGKYKYVDYDEYDETSSIYKDKINYSCKITIKLKALENEEIKNNEKIKTINDDEIKVLKIINEILIKHNKDTTMLRGFLLSTNVFSVSLFGELFKIKCRGKIKYILLTREENINNNISSHFKIVDAKISDRTKYRLIYQSINDIYFLEEYIIKQYDEIIKSNLEYIKNVQCGLDNYNNYLKEGYKI